MIIAQEPVNDKKRVEVLKSYAILDTEPDKDFDDITYIASQICGTPISLVSLIDENRQWFKSKHGLAVSETHRDYSFCAHAILDPDEIFEIPDSTKDARFADNPLVIDSPRVIFYAGVPLLTPEGYPLGTLCVIDNAPKKLDDFQRKSLRALGNQVIYMLELKKKIYELGQKQDELQNANQQLERFAQVASHDLKAPLIRIQAVTGLFKEEYFDKVDDEGKMYLDFLHDSSLQLVKLVEGVLSYSKNVAGISDKKESFDLAALTGEVVALLQLPAGFAVNYNHEPVYLETNRTALFQILLNLCSNAVRYNDKERGELSIGFEDAMGEYTFTVTDNGPGIAQEQFEKVFELFYTLDDRNRTQHSGTGIGLATVKNLVEHLGGSITIASEPGKYTTFRFSIKK